MMIHTTSREGRYSCELSSLFYLRKRTIFLTEEITDTLSTEITQQILYLAIRCSLILPNDDHVILLTLNDLYV